MASTPTKNTRSGKKLDPWGLLEAMPDAVVYLDSAGDVVYANAAASTLLACPPSKMIGLHFGVPVIQERPQELQVPYGRRKNLVLEMLAREVNVDGKIGYLLTLRDGTWAANARDELFQESLMDELTGLYNRRGLNLLSRQLMHVQTRAPRRFAALLVDLDDFKSINDRFGHHVGDEALVATAKILRECLRATDIVARLGGDEFVALAEGVDPITFLGVRQRIQARVSEFNCRPDASYMLAFSIGAAFFDPQTPIKLEDLILEADRQMYRAKTEQYVRDRDRSAKRAALRLALVEFGEPGEPRAA